MDKIIQVKIGAYRGYCLCDVNNVECKRNDYVILEFDRSVEFGKVISDENHSVNITTEQPQGKIIRTVTGGDINQIKNNEQKAQDAINICMRKINDRKLDMQIVKSEYTFDCSKIIFFFTSDGRVDFRTLVKDLAKIFRVRIELRQIGVRDKAKIVGGYGVCGRSLCCASYLKGFHPLSIRMAKEQALPLNPSRISGSCGRIKCCMAYEYFVYRELSKNLPHVGDKITTDEGKGRVQDINILKRVVVVDLGEGKTTRIIFPK